MEMRRLGHTEMKVSRLGIGLFQIGELAAKEASMKVDTLLGTALEQGLNFLDTAACYGESESYLGSFVSTHRQAFVLATKCGHLAGELQGQPWSADLVKHSLERSLARLQTDHIDLLQIHSCDKATLEKGEIIDALMSARDTGKTRFIGYSGDNEAAKFAVESGVFDTLQTSLNLVDQRALNPLLSLAKDKDMGVIIKRPLANMVWGAEGTPFGPGTYFQRQQTMRAGGKLPGDPVEPTELALGFLFSHEQVDTAIVGTTNVDHLLSNVEILENRLPIQSEVVDALHQRFIEMDDGWEQQM